MTRVSASERDHVFITGTRGRVGRAILPYLRSSFSLTEFDLNIDDPDGQARIRGDIRDFGALTLAVGRIRPDCIVHLAANANQDAPEEEIHEPNIQGTRNVFEAAALGGVRKIVYASSLHTLSGYPGFAHQSPFEDNRKLHPSDPPNPGNPYGASKVFGEELAWSYHEKYGIKTVCLRLGDVNDENKPSDSHIFRTVWLSHADAAQVFHQAIVADVESPVAVYFATSDNDGAYDIAPTMHDLGYTPLDGVAKR